jgi:hypothetical protein
MMVAYWDVVQAAVQRGLAEYSNSYFIPANGICGFDRDAQRKLAETWGDIASPYITACIQEDLRKAGVTDHDWRSIAGRIYLDNGGYNLLSTSERDAAELAAEEEGERRWGTNRDRTADAATGLEGR